MGNKRIKKNDHSAFPVVDETENHKDEEVPREELELEAQVVARAKQKFVQKPQINNKIGLQEKVAELLIKLPSGTDLPWVETFALTTDEGSQVKDVHDDLERETTFYQHALWASNEAHSRFDKFKIPYKRPIDYFAEMVKSDEHMEKMKGTLLTEKKRVEHIEERKKQKDIKKYSKQVQVAQNQEKQKKKKSDMTAVTKWRKSREKGSAPEEFPVELLEEESKVVSKKRKATSQSRGTTNKQIKDKKYGFGGRKRGAKGNTAETASDMSAFNIGKNKKVDRDLKSRLPSKGKKQFNKKRPGKSKRQHKG